MSHRTKFFTTVLACALISSCGSAKHPPQQWAQPEATATESLARSPSDRPGDRPSGAVEAQSDLTLDSEQEPLPVPTELNHGGIAWAVYLAKGDPKTPAFTVAEKRAKRFGLRPDYKDANCDVAVDGGPVPAPSSNQRGNTPASSDKKTDIEMLIASYYDSEAKARVVAARLGKTLWVGQVKTFCLD